MIRRTVSSHGRARGFTLIELLVAIAIASIVFAVSAIAIGSPPATEDPASWESQREAGRRRAVYGGMPVVVVPDSAHRSPAVLFLPDGRSIGDGADSVAAR